MKVLYISHHRESSGWGQVARDYILAMDKVGITVVPKAVKLGNYTNDIDKRILELEQQNINDYDVCIQHILPHYLVYNGYFKKNITIFETETHNLKYKSWIKKINMMDEAWVPCNSMLNDNEENGITIPTHVVPHATNTDKFMVDLPPLKIGPLTGNFVFYFIGELNRRKHISALLRAFHTEFSSNEPVSLLLKVNKYGLNSSETKQAVTEMSKKVKENLKLHSDINSYKSEIIISDRLSDQDMIRLHRTCDCFVMPSFGEAWSIPTINAMAVGNIPICTNTGGMADYVTSDCGFLIEANREPVFGMLETFEEFGKANETWDNINISQLMLGMRNVYEMSDTMKKIIGENCKNKVKEYSYEKIGSLIKDLLSV